MVIVQCAHRTLGSRRDQGTESSKVNWDCHDLRFLSSDDTRLNRAATAGNGLDWGEFRRRRVHSRVAPRRVGLCPLRITNRTAPSAGRPRCPPSDSRSVLALTSHMVSITAPHPTITRPRRAWHESAFLQGSSAGGPRSDRCCRSGPSPPPAALSSADRPPDRWGQVSHQTSGPGSELLDSNTLLFTTRRGGTMPKLDQETGTSPDQ